MPAEEPYHLPEEDGYESEWPPSAEDFEAQLTRSLVEIQMAANDVLLDDDLVNDMLVVHRTAKTRVVQVMTRVLGCGGPPPLR